MNIQKPAHAASKPASFNWEDPFLLDGQLTDEERMIRDAAAAFAKKNNLPLYEAARVGYPQRMREWTARRKAAGEASPGAAP